MGSLDAQRHKKEIFFNNILRRVYFCSTFLVIFFKSGTIGISLSNVIIVILFLIAGGRRGNITLGHVLCFVTGTDEEPFLGYSLEPSLLFVASVCFLPTANTCINCMKLPRGSVENPLPSTDVLFNLYDYAYANSYFGLI